MSALDKLEQVYQEGAVRPEVVRPMLREAVRIVSAHLEESGSPIRLSLEELKGKSDGIIYLTGSDACRVIGYKLADDGVEIEGRWVPLQGHGAMLHISDTLLAAIVQEIDQPSK